MSRKMAQKSSSENGWQDAKPNVHARISHLLQNDLMSDFTFVSEGVKFPVHKLVLASTSSVFYSMFYGTMAEQKQELDLSSFGNAGCISQFLKFIYTDVISLNWKNVFKLLNLAKCYLISSLQKRCTEFIEESITKDNVLVALWLTLLFDVNTAIKKCFEIISENAPEILKQDSFLALNLASLKAILELDTLEIKEIDLFLAVNRWCESQLMKEGKEVSPELKRKVLGDAVYLIRFPVMEWNDFGEHCSKSGILTQEQVTDIIHFISLDGKDLQETLVDKFDFCTKPRNGQKPEKDLQETLVNKKGACTKPRNKRRNELVAERFLHNTIISGHWGCNGRSDAIDFTINKKAYLTGISLFGNPRSIVISKMAITTNAGIFMPSYTFGEPNSGPKSQLFRVSFGKPIKILANQKVNVCVVISGPIPRHQYHIRKETFEIDGFQCQFSNASNSDNGTNVNEGQFPALVFNM